MNIEHTYISLATVARRLCVSLLCTARKCLCQSERGRKLVNTNAPHNNKIIDLIERAKPKSMPNTRTQPVTLSVFDPIDRTARSSKPNRNVTETQRTRRAVSFSIDFQRQRSSLFSKGDTFGGQPYYAWNVLSTLFVYQSDNRNTLRFSVSYS